MKKIILTRHAKSSWKDISLRDIDRPLNNRGKKDAPMMAKILKEKGYQVDRIVLSPSRRTKDTAAFFISEFALAEEQVEIIENLYHGRQINFEEAYYQQSDEVNNLMMIGHNPGITYIVNNARGRSIDNVPTTGMVILEDNVNSWDDFLIENSKLVEFLIPKQFT